LEDLKLDQSDSGCDSCMSLIDQFPEVLTSDPQDIRGITAPFFPSPPIALFPYFAPSLLPSPCSLCPSLPPSCPSYLPHHSLPLPPLPPTKPSLPPSNSPSSLSPTLHVHYHQYHLHFPTSAGCMLDDMYL